MAARALTMLEWLQANDVIVGWMLAISVGTFLIGAIGGPIWVISIPSDYFAEKAHKRARVSNPGMASAMLALGRNLFGCVLVVAGILMLVLPGQGLLTILVGVMLMDLPGKYRIARSIIVHPPVLQSMNWIRRHAGRTPLVLDNGSKLK